MTVYCDMCNRQVSYTTSPEKLFGKIEGIYYEYDGMSARCSKCGCKVFVPEINEYNLKQLYKVKEKGKVNYYV